MADTAAPAKGVDNATSAKPSRRPVVALVAHDGKKAVMLQFAQAHRAILAQCELCGTGTTAGRIQDEVGLPVHPYLSGPLGGDLQIGARLSEGRVDALIFFRDPLTSQPHEPDVNALVRSCDVHNVAAASNPTSARYLLAGVAAEFGIAP